MPTLKILTIKINNSRINDIYNYVASNFGVRSVPSFPHISLRGPQWSSFSSKKIDNLKGLLSNPNFTIDVNGADVFSNDEECVVFLKVKCDALRNLWWKPSFPISKFGFNPHITVFKGNNINAKLILEYLDDVKFTINVQELSVYEHNMLQRTFYFWDS